MPDYETFSTTADVGIRIRGKGYERLFRNAIKGLNLLWFNDIPEPQPDTDDRSVHHF
ncbi:MAG: archease, partial [bacterium]|nr:archease [bacterium]